MKNVRHVVASCALLTSAGLLVPAATAGQAAQAPTGLTLVGQVREGLPNGNLGDMSFWGTRMAVAYGITEPRSGFAVVDIADPTKPEVLSTTDCAGSANDISLYRDLVLLSVDRSEHGGPARCGEDDGQDLGGLRIFSVADPAHPVEVRDIVATCNGSHTHTAVPDLEHRGADGTADPRLLVYLTNLACEPGEDSPYPKASVQVVAVPLTHPADAELVPTSIQIPHPVQGEDGCHDITVFATRRLALAACAPQGAFLWDVSNPLKPRQLSEVVADGTPEAERPNPANLNPNHSAAFSLDGRVLAVGEESGGGLINACNTQHDRQGEIRFYDVSDPARPVYRSAYKIPRPVAAQACSAHYFTPVHTQDGRRLFVSGWYGGGVTVVDATDPARPHEIAWYAPYDGVAFAAYEYNGYVYVSNAQLLTVPTQLAAGGSRLLEVLRLDGVQTRRLDHLDPQVQEARSDRPFRG